MFRLQFKILRKTQLLTSDIFQRYKNIPTCYFKRHLNVPMSRKLSKLLNIFNKHNQKWGTFNYNTGLKQSTNVHISKFKNCKSKKSVPLFKKTTKAISSKKCIIKKCGVRSGKNSKECSYNNKLPKNSLLIKIELPREELNVPKSFSNPARLTQVKSYNTLCAKYSKLQHILSKISRNNYKLRHRSNKYKDDDKLFHPKGKIKKSSSNKLKISVVETEANTSNFKFEDDCSMNNQINSNKSNLVKLPSKNSLHITKVKKNNVQYSAEKRNRKKSINIIIEISGMDNDCPQQFINSTKRTINIFNDVDPEEVIEKHIFKNVDDSTDKTLLSPIDPTEITFGENEHIISSYDASEPKIQKDPVHKEFTATFKKNDDIIPSDYKTKNAHDSKFNSKENNFSVDCKSKNNNNLTIESDVKMNQSKLDEEFKMDTKYNKDQTPLDAKAECKNRKLAPVNLKVDLENNTKYVSNANCNAIKLVYPKNVDMKSELNKQKEVLNFSSSKNVEINTMETTKQTQDKNAGSNLNNESADHKEGLKFLQQKNKQLKNVKDDKNEISTNKDSEFNNSELAKQTCATSESHYQNNIPKIQLKSESNKNKNIPFPNFETNTSSLEKNSCKYNSIDAADLDKNKDKHQNITKNYLQTEIEKPLHDTEKNIYSIIGAPVTSENTSLPCAELRPENKIAQEYLQTNNEIKNQIKCQYNNSGAKYLTQEKTDASKIKMKSITKQPKSFSIFNYTKTENKKINDKNSLKSKLTENVNIYPSSATNKSKNQKYTKYNPNVTKFANILDKYMQDNLANKKLSKSNNTNETKNLNISKQNTTQNEAIENNILSSDLNSTQKFPTKIELEKATPNMFDFSPMANKNSTEQNHATNLSGLTTEAEIKKTNNNKNPYPTPEPNNQVFNDIDCINPLCCSNEIQNKENRNESGNHYKINNQNENIAEAEQNQIQKNCINTKSSDPINEDHIQKNIELEPINMPSSHAENKPEYQNMNTEPDSLNSNINEQQQSKPDKIENTIPLDLEKQVYQTNKEHKCNISDVNKTKYITSTGIQIEKDLDSMPTISLNSKRNEQVIFESNVSNCKPEDVQNDKTYLTENHLKSIFNNKPSEFKNKIIKSYIKEILLKKIKPDHRIFKVRPYVKHQYCYEEITNKYLQKKSHASQKVTNTQMNLLKNVTSLDYKEHLHNMNSIKIKTDKCASVETKPNSKKMTRDFEERTSKQQHHKIQLENKPKAEKIDENIIKTQKANNQEIVLDAYPKQLTKSLENRSENKLINKSKKLETKLKEAANKCEFKNELYQNQVAVNKDSFERTKNKDSLCMDNNETCSTKLNHNVIASPSQEEKNSQENCETKIATSTNINNEKQSTIDTSTENQFGSKCKNTAATSKFSGNDGSVKGSENENKDKMKQCFSNIYPLIYKIKTDYPNMQLTDLPSLSKNINEIMPSKQNKTNLELDTLQLSSEIGSLTNDTINKTTYNKNLTEVSTIESYQGTKDNKQALLIELIKFNNLLSKQVTKAIEVDSGRINITAGLDSQFKKLKHILKTETQRSKRNYGIQHHNANEIEYETIKADLLNALLKFNENKFNTLHKEETKKSPMANNKSDIIFNHLEVQPASAYNLSKSKDLYFKFNNNKSEIKKSKKRFKKIKFIVSRKFNKLIGNVYIPKLKRYNFKSDNDNDDNGNKLKKSKAISKSSTNLNTKNGYFPAKSFHFNQNINHAGSNGIDKHNYNNKSKFYTAPVIYTNFSSKDSNNNQDKAKDIKRPNSHNKPELFQIKSNRSKKFINRLSLVDKAPDVYKVPDRQNKEQNEHYKTNKKKISSLEIENHIEKGKKKLRKYFFFTSFNPNENLAINNSLSKSKIYQYNSIRNQNASRLPELQAKAKNTFGIKKIIKKTLSIKSIKAAGNQSSNNSGGSKDKDKNKTTSSKYNDKTSANTNSNKTKNESITKDNTYFKITESQIKNIDESGQGKTNKPVPESNEKNYINDKYFMPNESYFIKEIHLTNEMDKVKSLENNDNKPLPETMVLIDGHNDNSVTTNNKGFNNNKDNINTENSQKKSTSETSVKPELKNKLKTKRETKNKSDLENNGILDDKFNKTSIDPLLNNKTMEIKKKNHVLNKLGNNSKTIDSKKDREEKSMTSYEAACDMTNSNKSNKDLDKDKVDLLKAGQDIYTSAVKLINMDHQKNNTLDASKSEAQMDNENVSLTQKEFLNNESSSNKYIQLKNKIETVKSAEANEIEQDTTVETSINPCFPLIGISQEKNCSFSKKDPKDETNQIQKDKEIVRSVEGNKHQSASETDLKTVHENKNANSVPTAQNYSSPAETYDSFETYNKNQFETFQSKKENTHSYYPDNQVSTESAFKMEGNNPEYDSKNKSISGNKNPDNNLSNASSKYSYNYLRYLSNSTSSYKNDDNQIKKGPKISEQDKINKSSQETGNQLNEKLSSMKNESNNKTDKTTEKQKTKKNDAIKTEQITVYKPATSETNTNNRENSNKFVSQANSIINCPVPYYLSTDNYSYSKEYHQNNQMGFQNQNQNQNNYDSKDKFDLPSHLISNTQNQKDTYNYLRNSNNQNVSIFKYFYDGYSDTRLDEYDRPNYHSFTPNVDYPDPENVVNPQKKNFKYTPQTNKSKSTPQTGKNNSSPQTGKNNSSPQTSKNNSSPQTGKNNSSSQTDKNNSSLLTRNTSYDDINTYDHLRHDYTDRYNPDTISPKKYPKTVNVFQQNTNVPIKAKSKKSTISQNNFKSDHAKKKQNIIKEQISKIVPNFIMQENLDAYDRPTYNTNDDIYQDLPMVDEKFKLFKLNKENSNLGVKYGYGYKPVNNTVNNVQANYPTYNASETQHNYIQQMGTKSIEDNSMADDPMEGNSMVNNSMVNNSMVGNSMASNSMAGNSMAGNSMVGSSMAGFLMTGNPMTGNSMAGNSMVGSSMAGNLMTGNPMTDNSMVNNPMVDNSMVNNSMVDNSMVDNSMVDNSMAGNSMAGNSMAGNSMAGNSMVGSSMSGNPMTGNPMTGNSMLGNSMVNQENKNLDENMNYGNNFDNSNSYSGPNTTTYPYMNIEYNQEQENFYNNNSNPYFVSQPKRKRIKLGKYQDSFTSTDQQSLKNMNYSPTNTANSTNSDKKAEFSYDFCKRKKHLSRPVESGYQISGLDKKILNLDSVFGNNIRTRMFSNQNLEMVNKDSNKRNEFNSITVTDLENSKLIPNNLYENCAIDDKKEEIDNKISNSEKYQDTPFTIKINKDLKSSPTSGDINFKSQIKINEDQYTILGNQTNYIPPVCHQPAPASSMNKYCVNSNLLPNNENIKNENVCTNFDLQIQGESVAYNCSVKKSQEINEPLFYINTTPLISNQDKTNCNTQIGDKESNNNVFQNSASCAFTLNQYYEMQNQTNNIKFMETGDNAVDEMSQNQHLNQLEKFADSWNSSVVAKPENPNLSFSNNVESNMNKIYSNPIVGPPENPHLQTETEPVNYNKENNFNNQQNDTSICCVNSQPVIRADQSNFESDFHFPSPNNNYPMYATENTTMNQINGEDEGSNIKNNEFTSSPLAENQSYEQKSQNMYNRTAIRTSASNKRDTKSFKQNNDLMKMLMSKIIIPHTSVPSANLSNQAINNTNELPESNNEVSIEQNSIWAKTASTVPGSFEHNNETLPSYIQKEITENQSCETSDVNSGNNSQNPSNKFACEYADILQTFHPKYTKTVVRRRKNHHESTRNRYGSGEYSYLLTGLLNAPLDHFSNNNMPNNSKHYFSSVSNKQLETTEKKCDNTSPKLSHVDNDVNNTSIESNSKNEMHLSDSTNIYNSNPDIDKIISSYAEISSEKKNSTDEPMEQNNKPNNFLGKLTISCMPKDKTNTKFPKHINQNINHTTNMMFPPEADKAKIKVFDTSEILSEEKEFINMPKDAIFYPNKKSSYLDNVKGQNETNCEKNILNSCNECETDFRNQLTNDENKSKDVIQKTDVDDQILSDKIPIDEIEENIVKITKEKFNSNNKHFEGIIAYFTAKPNKDKNESKDKTMSPEDLVESIIFVTLKTNEEKNKIQDNTSSNEQLNGSIPYPVVNMTDEKCETKHDTTNSDYLEKCTASSVDKTNEEISKSFKNKINNNTLTPKLYDDKTINSNYIYPSNNKNESVTCASDKNKNEKGDLLNTILATSFINQELPVDTTLSTKQYLQHKKMKVNFLQRLDNCKGLNNVNNILTQNNKHDAHIISSPRKTMHSYNNKPANNITSNIIYNVEKLSTNQSGQHKLNECISPCENANMKSTQAPLNVNNKEVPEIAIKLIVPSEKINSIVVKCSMDSLSKDESVDKESSKSEYIIYPIAPTKSKQKSTCIKSTGKTVHDSHVFLENRDKIVKSNQTKNNEQNINVENNFLPSAKSYEFDSKAASKHIVAENVIKETPTINEPSDKLVDKNSTPAEENNFKTLDNSLKSDKPDVSMKSTSVLQNTTESNSLQNCTNDCAECTPKSVARAEEKLNTVNKVNFSNSNIIQEVDKESTSISQQTNLKELKSLSNQNDANKVLKEEKYCSPESKEKKEDIVLEKVRNELDIVNVKNENIIIEKVSLDEQIDNNNLTEVDDGKNDKNEKIFSKANDSQNVQLISTQQNKEISQKNYKENDLVEDALIKLFDKAIQAIESINVNSIATFNKYASSTEKQNGSEEKLENDSVKYYTPENKNSIEMYRQSVQNLKNNRGTTSKDTSIKCKEIDNKSYSTVPMNIQPFHKKVQEVKKLSTKTAINSASRTINKNKSSTSELAAKSLKTIELMALSKNGNSDSTKSGNSQDKNKSSSEVEKKPLKKNKDKGKNYLQIDDSPVLRDAMKDFEDTVMETVNKAISDKNRSINVEPEQKAPHDKKQKTIDDNSTSKNEKKIPNLDSKNDNKKTLKNSIKDENGKKLLKLKDDFNEFEKLLENNSGAVSNNNQNNSSKSNNPQIKLMLLNMDNISKELISKDNESSSTINKVLSKSLEKICSIGKIIFEKTKDESKPKKEVIIQNKKIENTSKKAKKIKFTSSQCHTPNMIYGSVKRMHPSNVKRGSDVLSNSIVRSISRNDVELHKNMEIENSVDNSNILNHLSFGQIPDPVVTTSSCLMLPALLTEESLRCQFPQTVENYEEEEEKVNNDDNIQFEDASICRDEENECVKELRKEDQEFINFRKNCSQYNGFMNLAPSECVKTKTGTYVYIYKIDHET